MVELAVGTRAPEVVLTSADGKTYNLAKTLEREPLVVLAFFKSECPVCQMTFPYLERLARRHPTSSIWAISQDDEDETREFIETYGITFPVLLDEALQKSVEFELSSVPSIFLIGQDGRIGKSIIGFVKSDLESLNATLAESGAPAGSSPSAAPLFTQSDQFPEFPPWLRQQERALAAIDSG